jgi:hypothetical protein
MQSQLTAEYFRPHLDEIFVVRVDLVDPAYPTMDLTLIDVSLLGRSWPNAPFRWTTSGWAR